MHQADSPETAARYAAAALALMEERGIAKTPDNFALCYTYVSKRNPELGVALDALLTGPGPVATAATDDIHRRFLAADRETAALVGLSERLRAEIEAVRTELGSHGRDAASYGQALDSFSGRLAEPETPGGIDTAIGELLSMTRAMERQNRELQNKLEASTGEIDRLKVDLDVVRREAVTDPLTGIFNRKMFDTRLVITCREAETQGTHLSLVFIDIDNFKAFNDSYGHQVGDRVLQLLAATLTQMTKGQDMVARYGGEEFAVILPNTGIAGAAALAETLRAKVSEKEVRNRATGQNMGRITISIGVSTFILHEAVADFLARADRALYQAKSTGRNRVVTEREITTLVASPRP